MNWLKKIWQALNEPQPARDQPTRRAKPDVPRFSPSYEEESAAQFTPRAQQVLALARQEADRFNHNFVGTEHLLLGLIKLGQGVAVNVLQKQGLDLETVRKEVETQVGTGPDQKMIGSIPYTPRVKKVLNLAAKEARALIHTYVGTEHILLGLLREGDGVAARVLRNLGVEIESTRREILRELDPYYQPAETAAARPPSPEPKPAGPSETAKPDTAKPPRPGIELIDLEQRFDVYCVEGSAETMVYRNVRFKGGKRFIREDRDGLADFYELEHADGSTVFVAKYSVVKFCAPGAAPGGEKSPGSLP